MVGGGLFDNDFVSCFLFSFRCLMTQDRSFFIFVFQFDKTEVENRKSHDFVKVFHNSECRLLQKITLFCKVFSVFVIGFSFLVPILVFTVLSCVI